MQQTGAEIQSSIYSSTLDELLFNTNLWKWGQMAANFEKTNRDFTKRDKILYSKTYSPNTVVNDDARKSKTAKKILKRLSRKHLAQNQKQLAIYAFDYIGTHIVVDGVYEKIELDIFFEWLQKHHKHFESSAAIDIGANIGNHSLYFSSYFKKVFSFEPNHRTFKLLSVNSELVDNIECFNYGLSNKSENAFLHIPQYETGRSSIKAPGISTSNYQSSLIKLNRFDDVFISDLKIALMKIDVEGFEYEVLEGAKASIKQHQPLIIFEQHIEEFKDGTTKCIELLRSLDYKVFASIDRKNKVRKKLPRFIQNLYRWLRMHIFGSTYEITLHSIFEHRFYNFIIAVPEWMFYSTKEFR